jgi:hypothetical protein
MRLSIRIASYSIYAHAHIRKPECGARGQELQGCVVYTVAFRANFSMKLRALDLSSFLLCTVKKEKKTGGVGEVS